MLTTWFYILWCFLVIAYIVLIGQIVWAIKTHIKISKFILPWIAMSASYIFSVHILTVGIAALAIEAILYGILLILLAIALPLSISSITHYNVCVKKRKLSKKEFRITVLNSIVMLVLYILQVNLI